jgi:hypothetical protein
MTHLQLNVYKDTERIISGNQIVPLILRKILQKWTLRIIFLCRYSLLSKIILAVWQQFSTVECDAV